MLRNNEDSFDVQLANIVSIQLLELRRMSLILRIWSWEWHYMWANTWEYYRKSGNFRCLNIFVVGQDYEIKYHEIFYTLNNGNNEILFAVRKFSARACAYVRTYIRTFTYTYVRVFCSIFESLSSSLSLQVSSLVVLSNVPIHSRLFLREEWSSWPQRISELPGIVTSHCSC